MSNIYVGTMLLKSDDNILNWMVENYLPKRNEYILVY